MDSERSEKDETLFVMPHACTHPNDPLVITCLLYCSLLFETIFISPSLRGRWCFTHKNPLRYIAVYTVVCTPADRRDDITTRI